MSTLKQEVITTLKSKHISFERKYISDSISMMLGQALDANTKAQGFGATPKQRRYLYFLVSQADDAKLKELQGFLATLPAVENETVTAWLKDRDVHTRHAKITQKQIDKAVDTLKAVAQMTKSTEQYNKFIDIIDNRIINNIAHVVKK